MQPFTSEFSFLTVEFYVGMNSTIASSTIGSCGQPFPLFSIMSLACSYQLLVFCTIISSCGETTVGSFCSCWWFLCGRNKISYYWFLCGTNREDADPFMLGGKGYCYVSNVGIVGHHDGSKEENEDDMVLDRMVKVYM
jgi:hypothetical protein